MYQKINFNTDYVLLFNTENNPGKTIKYLTGIESDYAILLIRKRGKPILFISPLEKKPINKDIEIKTLNSLKQILSKIKQKKTVGLNYGEISKQLFDILKKELNDISIKDISKDILKSRKIKEKDEIKKISKAVKITEKIFKEVFKKIKSFKTENEVIQFIKKQILEEDVKQSFEPIVASGKNSMNPHYVPGKNSPLREGFCIIDMGVIYEGYCSDMTRTIYLKKTNSKSIIDEKIYLKVKEELKRLEKNIKTGDKTIKITFPMTHAIGHGIGLDVHEEPTMNFSTLKENMTIALEPAIYKKQKGIRIENNYIIEKNKLKRLGTLDYKLRIIKNKHLI